MKWKSPVPGVDKELGESAMAIVSPDPVLSKGGGGRGRRGGGSVTRRRGKIMGCREN